MAPLKPFGMYDEMELIESGVTALDDRLEIAVVDDVGRLISCFDIRNENDFCLSKTFETGSWLILSSDTSLEQGSFVLLLLLAADDIMGDVMSNVVIFWDIKWNFIFFFLNKPVSFTK